MRVADVRVTCMQIVRGQYTATGTALIALASYPAIKPGSFDRSHDAYEPGRGRTDDLGGAPFTDRLRLIQCRLGVRPVDDLRRFAPSAPTCGDQFAPEC